MENLIAMSLMLFCSLMPSETEGSKIRGGEEESTRNHNDNNIFDVTFSTYHYKYYFIYIHIYKTRPLPVHFPLLAFPFSGPLHTPAHLQTFCKELFKFQFYQGKFIWRNLTALLGFFVLNYFANWFARICKGKGLQISSHFPI